MRLLISFAFKIRVFAYGTFGMSRVGGWSAISSNSTEGASLHGTLLGLPGVSNTWAMAGERPVKRSGAVYMISYPSRVIRGDLETDTLKNSSSSTRDGKELWI